MIRRKEFRERLREAISASGLRKKEVAEQLGISQSLLSLWLGGSRQPTEELVYSAAAVLRVDVKWLREGSQEEAPADMGELKWWFRPQPADGGRDYGNSNVYATPADLRTFVRETGQNSLDAALPNSQITLRYSLHQLSAGSPEYGSFSEAIGIEEILRHAEAAGRTKSKLGSRLRAGLEALRTTKAITLLRLDDYGTTGLYGDETSGAEPSVYAALVRNNLDSSKRTTTAGGSFGVGKAVLWRCSEISTVLFASGIAPGFKPELKGYRFGGKTELTWRDLNGEEFAGPGWFGVDGTTGNSAPVAEQFLERAMLDRNRLPRGVDSNAKSGTSILIVGFRDPESQGRANVRELAQSIAQHAAQNFWPAIQRGRMRVWVEAWTDGKMDVELEVPINEHVLELRETIGKHDHDEVGETLVEPGDVVRVEFPFTIPATKPSALGIQSFEETVSTAVLLVRLASPEETQSEEINRVALTRGRGMVVRYWKRDNIVVGAQPFHAILLAGEAAGSGAPQIAAEQFLRLAEPPAHDDWKFQDELRENYVLGAKSKLDAFFDSITENLRKVVAPTEKAEDDGPPELRKLLQLNAGPTQATPTATLRSFNDEIEGDKWVIEADVHVNEKTRPLSILPRLWIRLEDGKTVRLPWSELTEVPGPNLDREGQNFIIKPPTRRFRFRGVSTSTVDSIASTRCAVQLDLATTILEDN